MLALLALLFLWGGAFFYFWSRAFLGRVAHLPAGEEKKNLSAQVALVRTAGIVDIVLGLALSLITLLLIP
jgi:hypothetical protein